MSTPTYQTLADIEREVLTFWENDQTFTKSITERPQDKPYVFYDGPPFVTGSPHYGSLLGSIAKDVIGRFWTMQGYRVERRWGWDCHGLPIENMIEKDLDIKNGKRGIEEMGVATFNAACRTAIESFDASWETVIKRIGRWVDFRNQYRTMDTTFMESVWWAFQQLDKKGYIYEDKHVILYCPRCTTPLSNFEIAMDNSYVDVTEDGTTYQFKHDDSTFFLAWSTTPWTKLATTALAVNPQLQYALVESNQKKYYLLASKVDSYFADTPHSVLKTITGSELVGLKYEPHFDFLKSLDGVANQVVAADYVSEEAGTGFVTLAVYGEDDWKVMKEQNIAQYECVDEEGKIDYRAGENNPWFGKNVYKANKIIDDHLDEKGLLFKREKITHSVATCYRCGTRLYHCPIPAWFINVQKMKPALIKANEDINWHPTHLKHGRFGKGLEAAPDWNISRSRYWGTPMPIWRGTTSDGTVHTRIIGSRAELNEWKVDDSLDFSSLPDIHREFIDEIELWVDDAKTVKGKRIPDVFDCWVESGSMSFASEHYPFENKDLFEKRYPAQFISEYIAQTRAWFYCMHVISVGLFDKPSFENAHTTGVIQAADGAKMSKSKKNYTDPVELIEREGADALRLYLLLSPVMKAENLAFQDSDVRKVRLNTLEIWRNCVVFWQTYQPEQFEEQQANAALNAWLRERTRKLVSMVTENGIKYQFNQAAAELRDYVSDLSTWYLRRSRDALRGGDRESWDTFSSALRSLAIVSAPFVPFISEWSNRILTNNGKSIHLSLWPSVEPYNQEALDNMEAIRKLASQGHAARKLAGIKVRQPLAAATINYPSVLSDNLLLVLAEELNVKKVIQESGEENIVLDTEITPDLQAEGEARDIVRVIQDLRRKAGLQPGDHFEAQLDSCPPQWQTWIEERTNTRIVLPQ